MNPHAADPDQVQFIACRKFAKNAEGHLAHFREELALYAEELALGKVIWLHMGGLNAVNWRELMRYCGEKGYTVFDVWGYVPGNKPSSSAWYLQDFGEFAPAARDHAEMLELLRGRFLGYDIGEQDSRYLMIFAPHFAVASLDRREQYRRHYDFFARMCRDLCGDYAVLAGGTNVHYLAKEAGCRMIGGEAIQVHPNINVWQAFIRGAARQYGIPWFGTVSVFNAFGFRMPHEDRTDEFGMVSGRNAGPSDSLLRRVFHLLYETGAALMGFEHFVAEEGVLTAVGEIQREVMALGGRKRHMVAPVAILLDFFQGWQPPRNAVQSATHRVWGELPYDEDDFRVDALFELLYPGYSDGAVFRDERGFLVNTPYGDVVEVLLTDMKPEILDAYKLVVIPGNLLLDEELRAKLRRFLDRGGRVVYCGQAEFEHANLVRIADVLEPTGDGYFVSAYERRLPPPYRLTAAARGVLDRELRRAVPFTVVGSALVAANTELLLVMNNAATPQNVAIPEAKFQATLAPGEFVRVPYSLAIPAMESETCRRQYALALRAGNWREQLMTIPALTNYVSGILITGSELLRLSDTEVTVQREFFSSRRLRVVGIDLTDLFSHYPGLSMLGTGSASPDEAFDTVREAVRKAALLDCRDLIVPTMKNSELVTPETETLDRIGRFLCRCADFEVMLHIAVLPHRYGDGVAAMRQRLAAWGLLDRIRLYCDTGALLTCRDYVGGIKHGYPKSADEPRNCFPRDYALIDEPRDTGTLAEILAPVAEQLALLGISAPLRDFAGRVINAHRPLADSPFAGEILQAAAQLPPTTVRVIDLDGADWNTIFATLQQLESL